MRRLALEGDVIGARAPPPRNVTEAAGWLNWMEKLNETAMREQSLAAIMGVAGPNPALGFDVATPLAMVTLSNDRPAGAAQPSIPTSALVRSDFVTAVQAAFKSLHDRGATLPLTGPSVITLPKAGPGVTAPANILFYLGRALMLAPQTALVDPNADPLALIRSNPGDPFAVASRVLSPGPISVTPATYDALRCTATTSTTVSTTGAFVPIGPVLAAAGFYQPSPPPQPANNTDISWAAFSNITGLVAGETLLGDELGLLYQPALIAQSVFAPLLNAIWNGTTFA
jgi:hypothetical protein